MKEGWAGWASPSNTHVGCRQEAGPLGSRRKSVRKGKGGSWLSQGSNHKDAKYFSQRGSREVTSIGRGMIDVANGSSLVG